MRKVYYEVQYEDALGNTVGHTSETYPTEAKAQRRADRENRDLIRKGSSIRAVVVRHITP